MQPHKGPVGRHPAEGPAMGEDGSAIHNLPTAPLGPSGRRSHNRQLWAQHTDRTQCGRLCHPQNSHTLWLQAGDATSHGLKSSATQRKDWQAGRGLLARQQTRHLWTRGRGPSQPLLTHPGCAWRDLQAGGLELPLPTTHHPPLPCSEQRPGQNDHHGVQAAGMCPTHGTVRIPQGNRARP